MRKLSVIVIIILLLTLATSAFPDTPKKRGEGLKLRAGFVQSLCIEGHVFIFSQGRTQKEDIAGPGILTQVYREMDGRVVPMQCEDRDPKNGQKLR